MPNESKFLITYTDVRYTPEGNFAWAETDIPAHCTLHWQTRGMVVHPRTRVRRGMPVTRDPHLGFDGTTPIDQEDPGDTLGHLWALPELEPGKVGFFNITCTVNSKPSPSASPIVPIQGKAPCPYFYHRERFADGFFQPAWDINSAQWSFNPALYISPPTSFQINQPNRFAAILKVEKSVTADICAIETWLRMDFTNAFANPAAAFFFRNQLGYGEPSFYTGYIVTLQVQQGRIALYRDEVQILFVPYTFTNKTWEHWRIQWWADISLAKFGVLKVLVQKEVAGIWQTLATFKDSENENWSHRVKSKGFDQFIYRDRVGIGHYGPILAMNFTTQWDELLVRITQRHFFDTAWLSPPISLWYAWNLSLYWEIISMFWQIDKGR